MRTIWLSPANAQTDKSRAGDGNQIFSAYHGYWPVKARAVEPRFGGDAALRAFVAEAHKRGIRVLLDLINNQVHERARVRQAARRLVPQATASAATTRTAAAGASARSTATSSRTCRTSTGHVCGAEKQFIADAVNWIAEFDLDGFRVDAVKHVEANSVFNMRAELSRRFEQGGARVFMVGETAVGEGDNGTFFGEHFDNGFEWIDAYTGPTALDGQFDFPTRHNMADGLVNGLQAAERGRGPDSEVRDALPPRQPSRPLPQRPRQPAHREHRGAGSEARVLVVERLPRRSASAGRYTEPRSTRS